MAQYPKSGGAGQAQNGSGGTPLPQQVRLSMQQAHGADFSTVRVHQGFGSDPAGVEARATGARAYATGDDVHFAPGAYDPHSARGQELLGHELSHVVQQRAGRVSATRL
jgi:hypothetical protein